jgi:aminopeptidase YwaD
MRILFFVFILFLSLNSYSQTKQQVLDFARAEIDTLCSATFAGRGYLHEGHRKAAAYVARRFEEMGVESMQEMAATGTDRYLQEFPMQINLAKELALSLNGQEIAVGAEVIPNRYSGSGEVSGKVLDLKYGLEPSAKAQGRIVLFRAGWPAKIANDSEKREKYAELSRVDQRIGALLEFGPAAIIVVQAKLTAGFARERLPIPVVEVLETAIKKKVRKANLQIKTAMTSLRSQNVIGQIRGTEEPDSYLILCAHYDHLGQLSEAIFTGANDNASGTAMLLSMAAYFVENPLKQTLILIAFGGEETGLLGSAYYVNQQPAVPLAETSFVLNLDLMGNGIDGITAVGGRDYPEPFEKLVRLNEEMESVPVVKSRTNAPNSDHYYFLKNGIPGFFIYTLGGPKHYHDVYDNPSTIVLSRYAEVRELLIAFLESL